jgi:hypothetical protein
MNKIFRSSPLILSGLVLLLVTCAADAADKWKTLFDGRDTKAWRTYNGKGFPKAGWEVVDGCLHLKAGGQGGELVTMDTFEDFEFEWEWKIAPKANNGIKYLVTEERPNMPGPEYQMVDDSTMPEPKHKTASFYDVLPIQVPTTVKPPGEWNQSRLVISGSHIEHWLNGVKVLTFELGSPEVKAALAKSKFRDAPGYGDKIKGHILLTNHHDEAWYRNIRIRKLPAK